MWLNNRCFAIEATASKPVPAQTDKAKKVATETKAKSALPVLNSNSTKNTPPVSYTPKCHLCGEAHYLSQCKTYLSKSVHERETFVSLKRLCRNCLRPGHIATQCRSSKCRSCGKNHHTSLHVDAVSCIASNSNSTDSSTNTDAKASLTAIQSSIDVLLPTAVVKVCIGPSCSQVNLVTESFVRRNRLPTRPSSTSILGVAPSRIQSNHIVSLVIESRFNKTQLHIDAETVGSLPYRIEPRVNRLIKIHEPGIQLADSRLDTANVDILIGVEYWSRITTGEKFIAELCLENSKFGWLTVGLLQTKLLDPKVCCVNVTVHDILTRFWEAEEVTPPKITFHEHELCENHFKSTRSRLPDGKFSIRLPFKTSTDKLANTYKQAYNALIKYEKSDELIRTQYVDFMRDYLHRDHMRLANPKEDVQRYFIPHLPVLREDSYTTKLRVVFNTSAENNTGISLNKALLNGPVHQPPLFNILINFRRYIYAFSADIEKMYRCIDVDERDRKFQSILWRFNVTDPVEIYELTTLTYGTGPAAYVATERLLELPDEVP